MNQKFHWAVLNSSKGRETSVKGNFLREGSASWGGFQDHLCGQPCPHSDVQIVLGPSTGLGQSQIWTTPHSHAQPHILSCFTGCCIREGDEISVRGFYPWMQQAEGRVSVTNMVHLQLPRTPGLPSCGIGAGCWKI